MESPQASAQNTGQATKLQPHSSTNDVPHTEEMMNVSVRGVPPSHNHNRSFVCGTSSVELWGCSFVAWPVFGHSLAFTMTGPGRHNFLPATG